MIKESNYFAEIKAKLFDLKRKANRIKEDSFQDKIKETKIFVTLPHTDDLSYSNLVDRLYTLVLLNNSKVEMEEEKWNIVFSQLYNLFYLHNYVDSYETYMAGYLLSQIDDNNEISIDKFLNSLIPTFDMLLDSQAPITQVDINKCKSLIIDKIRNCYTKKK